MRRTWRQLSAAAACCAADEGTSAVDRARRDPRPYRAPRQMGDGHAGVCVDSLIRLRHNLIHLAGAFEIEARATSSAHAKCVPPGNLLDTVVVLAKRDENLIGCRRIGRTARR